MQSGDNVFFEEYKHLDKICSEIYSCQDGIKQYIADMEENSANGQLRVPGWNSDYQKLKHVKWVRNKIAHESGIVQFSTEEDLAFVKTFYDRILSGDDPLTLLHKSSKPLQETKTAIPPVQIEDYPFFDDTEENSTVLPIILIAGFVIIVLIVIIFLIKYLINLSIF